MVPEISSATDIIFCNSGPFFCPFTPLWNQKTKIFKKWKKYLKILSFYKDEWQQYDVWFFRYGVQWAECFVISDHLLNSLTTQKIKILKKWKNTPGDIIILHKCATIMIRWCTVPKIWCMTDVIVISLLGFFCPFTPLTAQKTKILKK